MNSITVKVEKLSSTNKNYLLFSLCSPFFNAVKKTMNCDKKDTLEYNMYT